MPRAELFRRDVPTQIPKRNRPVFRPVWSGITAPWLGKNSDMRGMSELQL